MTSGKAPASIEGRRFVRFGDLGESDGDAIQGESSQDGHGDGLSGLCWYSLLIGEFHVPVCVRFERSHERLVHGAASCEQDSYLFFRYGIQDEPRNRVDKGRERVCGILDCAQCIEDSMPLVTTAQ